MDVEYILMKSSKISDVTIELDILTGTFDRLILTIKIWLIFSPVKFTELLVINL